MREPGSSQRLRARPEGTLLDHITGPVGGEEGQESSGLEGRDSFLRKRAGNTCRDMRSLPHGRCLPRAGGSLSLTLLVTQAASGSQHGHCSPALLPVTLLFSFCPLAALGPSCVKALWWLPVSLCMKMAISPRDSCSKISLCR